MSQFFPFRMSGQKLAVFASLAGLLAQPVWAASQIGVTAALRGEVVRTASFNAKAAIGQMSSGQSVFLGDDIKVGNQGRMQVMLLDETIFTLGANSVMRIDEFVYDPSDTTKNSLSTSIKQGAFRFVSGQVAKRDAGAMTVKLPSATIGVRGTSVAGEVDKDGSAQVILLGPAPDNSLGLPAGAINVANEAGVVDITRPGFVTEIAAFTAPPAPPQQATPTQIRQLEQALSEDAVSELAEGLGVDSTEIVVQAGKDSDGDGQLDSFSANENLSNAILAATGSEGGVTNDRELLQQVAETLFADEMAEGGPDGESFFQGINLGEDIGNLLAGDFEYLGPTQISELADFGPTGRVTFTGAGAKIEDVNGRDSGTFGLTQVWDFGTDQVSSTISGDFSIDAGNNQIISGNFIDDTQTLSFAEAQGQAAVVFTTSFSAMIDPDNPSDPASLQTPHVYADLGGDDNGQNVSMFHEVGAFVEPDSPSVAAAGLSAFAELTDGQNVLIDNTDMDGGYQLEFRVSSFLSNVDRKDGSPTTAAVGEGGVEIDLVSVDYTATNEDDQMTRINRANGSIFAMKRTQSE